MQLQVTIKLVFFFNFRSLNIQMYAVHSSYRGNNKITKNLHQTYILCSSTVSQFKFKILNTQFHFKSI